MTKKEIIFQTQKNVKMSDLLHVDSISHLVKIIENQKSFDITSKHFSLKWMAQVFLKHDDKLKLDGKASSASKVLALQV